MVNYINEENGAMNQNSSLLLIIAILTSIGMHKAFSQHEPRDSLLSISIAWIATGLIGLIIWIFNKYNL
jgi:cytoskeletal protein RodZ